MSGAASKVEIAKEAITHAIDELAQQLESGKSENLIAYLNMLAKFHRYSYRNLMLINAQRPEASNVAGFQTWKTMGRTVMKGEKGIVIIAPMVRKTDKSKPDEKSIFGFRTTHVFDVAQTEGEDLPDHNRIGGSPGDKLAHLEAAIQADNIQLQTAESLGGAIGVSTGGTIEIIDSVDGAERFAVLVHEWAHEILHQRDKESRPSKTICETEAEAIAFVVCHAVGLETGTASSDYIQIYNGNKETLVASLDRIQKTAHHIIEAIDNQNGNSGPSPTNSTPKPPQPSIASNAAVAKPETEVHELELSRFAPGEFCYQKERTVGEGDIVSSYSADKIAFTNSVRNPFTWKGQQWIMTGGKGSGIQAYRLVHPEAFPRTATTYEQRTRDDGGEAARHDPNGFYDGMTVTRGKKTYILCGPPVKLMPGKAAQTSLFEIAQQHTR
ncbi:hypothetical protein COB72_05640 [bacterium]|nr:MAG: hypothetical protein COB72_05640 [bacterium]